MMITATMLTRALACNGEVDRFREVFGERVRLTRANLLKAADAGLYFAWLMDRHSRVRAFDILFVRTNDDWEEIDAAGWELKTQRGRERRVAHAMADHWGLK